MSTTSTATIAGRTIRLRELASVIHGELSARPQSLVEGYAIDSRAAAPGIVFFALTGERTDGHRFLNDVLSRGATAVVVRRDAEVPVGLDCIRVDDPAAALAALGRHFRERWPLTVVGITGSAGKTTTKDVTAALLATQRKVFKSEGNFNTTIGLPLTLTRRQPSHQVAVLEMGMSFPGELRRVAAIAEPDIAVITNIGLAHAGNFTSIDDVAKAKGEILLETRSDGTFVANADDPRVMSLAHTFGGSVITFGIGQPADLRASSLEPLGVAGTAFMLEADGERQRALIPFVGAHQVGNVLAALAVARACGLSPFTLLGALTQLVPSPSRGGVIRLTGDVTVIDDSYNANPAAMIAALDALHTVTAVRRVAILGDMLELGAYAPGSHAEIGRHAVDRCDVLITVGPESVRTADEAIAAGLQTVHHEVDAQAAVRRTLELVCDGDAILIKGSRGIGLEAVVAALLTTRRTLT